MSTQAPTSAKPSTPEREACQALADALRRVMRHIPNDAGGASLGDDMHRARQALNQAAQVLREGSPS
jgi:hypothetical protein